MSGISSISSSMTSPIYAQAMKRPDPAEMFKKVDTDSNGGISQSELDAMAEEMASRSGKTLDMSEAIATYDLDGDSLLSQDEMGTMMMALRESMGAPPQLQGSGVSFEQMAAAYQANSDDSETLSVLLDLMDRYIAKSSTDSTDDSFIEI